MFLKTWSTDHLYLGTNISDSHATYQIPLEPEGWQGSTVNTCRKHIFFIEFSENYLKDFQLHSRINPSYHEHTYLQPTPLGQ